MARTVVHPSGGGLEAGGQEGDPYLDKLAKYVPAEVVALFVALVAVVALDETGLIAALVAGVLLTPLYLYGVARREPPEKRPRWYFYILAAIAFLVWAVGTTPTVSAAIGIPETAAAFGLVVGVFAIPLIDSLLTT